MRKRKREKENNGESGKIVQISNEGKLDFSFCYMLNTDVRI